MAERGALPLLRPSLPRPSIFLSFSNLRASRFQKPTSSASHLHYPSSSRSTVVSVKIIRRRFIYKIRAVAEEEGRYGRMERGKRGRKRRQLWEELLEDNVEDDDDDVDGGGGGDNGKIDLWKILEEIVDNVWILKAFKSYGYLLPFILLSLFFSTGPKAFLISLGVAIGPSLLFLAFQKVTGWDKRRRTSTANQFGVEMGDERRSRVRYTPSQVRNSGSAGMASNFGGWDELEGLGTVSEQPRTEPRRKPMKKRKKIRREEAAEAQPLLLRLLLNRTEPVKRLVINLLHDIPLIKIIPFTNTQTFFFFFFDLNGESNDEGESSPERRCVRHGRNLNGSGNRFRGNVQNCSRRRRVQANQGGESCRNRYSSLYRVVEPR
ncbi:unnamed protein product [Brassica napus]|uniref:(rape) hypothetical protein n=1 Tax=Brassica napus TaxID=3708 RepID=A0A817B2B2_BRANA|nr:unnamed protein product [Brassica napus]